MSGFLYFACVLTGVLSGGAIGMVAGTISKMGHAITQKIESAFALPDDLLYHKTGSMMASRLIAASRTFHITDPDVADTMRSFVNQCVFFDALLEKPEWETPRNQVYHSRRQEIRVWWRSRQEGSVHDSSRSCAVAYAGSR